MKSAAKTVRVSSASAEQQLKSFINKFDAKHQAVIRAARKILRKRFPTANEIVYDNYNFFVIGYSPTARPSDTIVSIAGAANGIGLSFYHGATIPDPHRLLQGSGTQNRFLRLPSADLLEQPEVVALIDEAVEQARAPLAKSGKGKLIIQSIAAKQKPRRKPA